jgi:hypothetical protein
MEHKLIMEGWRRHLNEIGMSRAALGVSEDDYRQIMKPAQAKVKLGLKDLYELITIIDPTSITSYPEAARALKKFYDEPSWFNGAVLTLSLLALIPVAGKVAKAGQKGLQLKAKTLNAAAKMKKALTNVPGAAGHSGKIEAAYAKYKDFEERADS